MKKTLYFCDSCGNEISAQDIFSPYGLGAGTIDSYSTQLGDSTVSTRSLQEVLLCPECNTRLLAFLKNDLGIEFQEQD